MDVSMTNKKSGLEQYFHYMPVGNDAECVGGCIAGSREAVQRNGKFPHLPDGGLFKKTY